MNDKDKQRRVHTEHPKDEQEETVQTEPGEMYETPASEDDITPNDETTSKTPGNKPSQAEGSRRTVEENLKQKRQNG